MKITKRLYNLKKGTTLAFTWGMVELTSEYNENKDTYDYVELEINEDGDLVATEKTGTLCPVDLIGAEIF